MAVKRPAKKAAPRRSADAERIKRNANRFIEDIEENEKLKASMGLIRIAPSIADALEDPSEILEWTDEELRQGFRQGPQGPATFIPRKVYQELFRRTLDECRERLRDQIPELMTVLIQIAKQGEDKDRIAAIKLIMDRVMGPVKQELDVTSGGERLPWRDALDVAIISEESDEPEPSD